MSSEIKETLHSVDILASLTMLQPVWSPLKFVFWSVTSVCVLACVLPPISPVPFRHPGLPDMKQVGRQIQRAAAMEASKLTRSKASTFF